MVVYVVVSPSVFEALAMQQTEYPSETFVPHTAIAASVHELSENVPIASCTLLLQLEQQKAPLIGAKSQFHFVTLKWRL